MNSFHERRITVRLMAYWEKLRKGRPMPAEADIDPDDIQDLWDHCFLVHVQDLEKPDYQYTYLGAAILQVYRGGLSESEAGSLLSPDASHMHDSFVHIAKTGKPVVDEGEFRNFNNEVVKYRQCLLPLGENGAVQAIFGGMRCKVYQA